MKKKGRIKNKIASVFELPVEAAAGAVRIIVHDNTDIFLENHKGIVRYTQNNASIRAGTFDINIKGKDMELSGLGKENLIIKGQISAIEFEVKRTE